MLYRLTSPLHAVNGMKLVCKCIATVFYYFLAGSKGMPMQFTGQARWVPSHPIHSLDQPRPYACVAKATWLSGC